MGQNHNLNKNSIWAISSPREVMLKMIWKWKQMINMQKFMKEMISLSSHFIQNYQKKVKEEFFNHILIKGRLLWPLILPKHLWLLMAWFILLIQEDSKRKFKITLLIYRDTRLVLSQKLRLNREKEELEEHKKVIVIDFIHQRCIVKWMMTSCLRFLECLLIIHFFN